jgi:hypothetical protein
MTEASVAGTDKKRATLARMIQDQLRAGETILAILPFTNTQKRPKKPGEGRKDKVRTGVYQSWRRYRPLVLTDRRLFVFETGRTPFPRALLAEFPVDQIELSDVEPGRFGATRFVLDLPSIGRVPFEAGSKEQRELTTLRETLNGPST